MHQNRIWKSRIGALLLFVSTFALPTGVRAQSMCTEMPIPKSSTTSDGGYSYLIPILSGTLADTSANPDRSILRVFENGIEIGPAHSSHAQIRSLGQGQFSHWADPSGANESLRLSALDNSNVQANNRIYTYCVPDSQYCEMKALTLSNAVSDGGFAYYLPFQFDTLADTSASPNRSVVRFFEGINEMGPAHSTHSDIRNLGGGRFSHWTPEGSTGEGVFFSSTDNTNPKSNGRTYSYCMGAGVPLSRAIGYGRNATGGAGGTLCTVTNLNDSGVGSLRDCLSVASRNVNFAVSGTINLSSPLFLKSQTTVDATGVQVAIKNYGFRLHGVNNVVIRNLSLLNGVGEVNDQNLNNDAIQIWDGSTNIWIDKITAASWPDEIIDISHASRFITISNSLLYNVGAGSGYAVLIGSSSDHSEDVAIRVTMHNNVFLDHKDRKPHRLFVISSGT